MILQDPQRCCLGAQEAVSPHVAHGDSRSRDAMLPSLPAAARRRELHAGTRSLRRRRPCRRRPPCSMLPPRWSPAALAAGQTPAPEGGKKLDNSRGEAPAGLAGAACAQGQTMTLVCSACHKVWTAHRCPCKGGTVRAWREPPRCRLQSTSIASSSCLGKPLPSCSGRTSLFSVLG